MRTDEILTPLKELQSTALQLVMANAPELNILTSAALVKAIVREVMTAEKGAAKRAISAVGEAAKR